ncbi:pseudaminic acid cytidylyltransferase [Myroides odoratimimus]|uniref:pseudaminic acid cytidylyltransferase n=1 Tax=Myroides odoratimimus TaxID=76832 RepID=UPI003D2F2BF6
MYRNICIIPARGGSKRIPRKNIKDFLGKPIIAYSIEAAKKSGLFSTIVVSTDDVEIAEIAKMYGAEVPFLRSKENANDYATLSDVVEEVKNWYLKKSIEYDFICCLLATAPFVTTLLLKDAFEVLKETEVDSIRPIVKFSYPVQRGYHFNDSGRVTFLYPEFAKTRSQDLEPVYFDAGLFYWMKFETGFESDIKGGFIVSEQVVQDIDTLEDWSYAELKYKILYGVI